MLSPKEGVLFTQARQTLVLLPSITEQLQGADSDTRAVALPVLSTMLRLLEGRTLSLTALELAGKLPALFGDVRLRPHGCVPGTARCGLSLPASQPWALRALGQALGRAPLARFGALLGARGLCPQRDRCPPLALPRSQVRCGFSRFASSSTRWALWRAAKRSCSRWHTGACSRCPSTCTTRTRAWPRWAFCSSGEGDADCPALPCPASGAPEHQGCCSCWQR